MGVSMAAKIYISYRRDDDPAAAARMCDGLARKFGRANLFIDVDNVRAGQRFEDELIKALDVSNVLIAVIGLRWMELLRAKDASGERDYVRQEIAAALQRNGKVIVVPVRVGREGQLPPLPQAQDLPEDIRELVLYQKHDVTHERFGRDTAELTKAIASARRWKRSNVVTSRVRLIAATAMIVLAVGYVAAHFAGVPVPWLQGPDEAVQPAKSARPDAERRADEAAQAQKAIADAEARRRADETAQAAKAKTEAEQRRKADAEQAAKVQAEADARRKADEAAKAATAKREAEERRKAEEAAQAAKVQAEADARRKEEQERQPLSLTPGSGQSFRDRLGDGQPCPWCPAMVVVPRGNFTMGSPVDEPMRGNGETRVPVSIARPFAVGKFAVTRGEFADFVKETDHSSPADPFACLRGRDWRTPGFTQSDQDPVVCINWADAKAYVEWLSKKTGKNYRLLSEAEREYVTRAGTTTQFWWGNSISTAQANYDPYGDRNEGENRKKTMPVDSFKPNPWGLYNVHGNVWEWTADCWSDSNSGNPGNGAARTARDCGLRVIRGGSWDSFSTDLRSAARRLHVTPYSSANNLGFRVGRALTP
jgi:formylglycine-generating enzyme required for sulfatase activity